MAGETSGDMQAAHFVRALQQEAPFVNVHGVGGSYLASAGVNLFLDSSTWGAIGYVEPLLRLPRYVWWLGQVEQEVRRRRPVALVLVDFPGFNLPLAKRLRSFVPILYYFPPMVSVRRGDRAQRVAALGMRLLAVFRREEAAYRAAGANVRFIGHPAVDQVRPQWDAPTARAQFHLAPSAPIVGLLPGSRRQEIRAHLPVLLDASARLRAAIPELQFVLPVPAAHLRPVVSTLVARSGQPVRIVAEIYDAMAIARVLIVSSGSATLEAAILGIPMVAIYRLPFISARIVRRFINTPYVALPNILGGREVVPELIQERMTPEAIADAVRGLLGDPLRWERVRSELLMVAQDLGEPGAVVRAAQEVRQLLGGAGRVPLTV